MCEKRIFCEGEALLRQLPAQGDHQRRCKGLRPDGTEGGADVQMQEMADEQGLGERRKVRRRSPRQGNERNRDKVKKGNE